MQKNMLDRHFEIIKTGPVNIYTLSDNIDDKTVYEVFYRNCVTAKVIDHDNCENEIRKINEEAIIKMHLWGFSPRRIKRILKYATIDFDISTIEELLHNKTDLEKALIETVEGVSHARMITDYERALLHVYKQKPKYTEESLKYICFDLDVEIGKFLCAGGVENGQIVEMLYTESFLLEDKLFKKDLAEAIVGQIKQTVPVEVENEYQSLVLPKNTYNNCNFFMLYNKDSEAEVHQFVEKLINQQNSFKLQMIVFDEMSAVPTPLPEITTLTGDEYIPSKQSNKNSYNANLAEEMEVELPADAPVENCILEKLPDLPKKDSATPQALIEKNSLVGEPSKKVLEDDEEILVTKKLDDFNARLMKIKNHDPIPNMKEASPVHFYKDMAVSCLKRSSGYWHESFDVEIIQAMLDAKINTLRILNIVAAHSPLFDGFSDEEATDEAEKLIYKARCETATFDNDVAQASYGEDDIKSELYEKVFAQPEEKICKMAPKENYAMKAIKFFEANKPYDELEAEDKYLFLAQKLLTNKDIWDEQNDIKIAYQLLRDKETKVTVSALIAKNTPAIVENKMDYADSIMSQVDFREGSSEGENEKVLIEKPKLSPEREKKMIEGINLILEMEIPDIDFEDLQPRGKYAYLAQAKLKSGQKMWCEDDDIDICRELLKTGVTEILTVTTIETFSPLAVSLPIEDKSEYAEKVLEKAS